MAFPSIFRGHPISAFDEAGDPVGPLERALENLWRGSGAPTSATPAGHFAPRIDVVERAAEYLVTAELPGLEEKDFQLEVHGNVMILTGEKRTEHEEERKGWRWSERSYGNFRRSIQLPRRGGFGQGVGGVQERRADRDAAEGGTRASATDSGDVLAIRRTSPAAGHDGGSGRRSPRSPASFVVGPLTEQPRDQ
ncbi:MAG: Hsp20/alpha crystallin family protein [Myxococcota bacterium]|nr:Hsp20/alpha crystallin family protein [Myxococcota bacterium]